MGMARYGHRHTPRMMVLRRWWWVGRRLHVVCVWVLLHVWVWRVGGRVRRRPHPRLRVHGRAVARHPRGRTGVVYELRRAVRHHSRRSPRPHLLHIHGR